MPMKTIICNALCLLFITFLSAPVLAQNYNVEKITMLEVDASINPAIFNYIEDNLSKLSSKKGDLLLIKLDTPGGLVSTTKDIITLLGKKDIPLVIWITPEGASATSAGAIIASAAHVLVMSEGTNMGAATPIGLGQDIEQKDAKSKAVNDLVALVRSLASSRGRNADEFGKMISEAKSIDSRTALKEKVIDGIINSQIQLISFLNEREIYLLGKKLKLVVTPQTEFIPVSMDPGQQILNMFSHPSTAYILFIIGAALLYFEFQAPGGFVAGSVGALCLLLAGIGFQILPVNIGALGLIILSFILFVVEVYVTSFGVLTVAGLASLIFGSLFLFRTEDSFIQLEQSLVFSVAGVVAIYVLLVGFFLLKTYKKRKSEFTQNEREGVISKIIGENKYQVKVNGEIWHAVSDSELNLGEQVIVYNHSAVNLVLKIKKLRREA